MPRKPGGSKLSAKWMVKFGRVYEGKWQKFSITGSVFVGTADVFVKYFFGPLLNKKTNAFGKKKLIKNIALTTNPLYSHPSVLPKPGLFWGGVDLRRSLHVGSNVTAFSFIFVEYIKNVYGWSDSAPPGRLG